jgi:cysteinyl-tRNA synthetase
LRSHCYTFADVLFQGQLMLKIYNSLTRKKEVFIPINPGHIGLYVCGNTVYDHCHLGHARSMVCFDVIVRFLRFTGYKVKYVRNITDIDDKIIKRANERNISFDELTNEFILAQQEDANQLMVLDPDNEPRATQYIEEIIKLIVKLIATNHAYVSGNGDVCYAVESCADYGKLSQQNIHELQSGVRIAVDSDKRSALDFVLWKLAKPGEPSWESPWGKGRPGWHIECSAMAMDVLGEQFDLHGGGLDLQFPHHENEIAQSECVTGKTFANYWLHVGMLQVNNEKMSKSLGNFFTIRDVLAKHHPEVVRYFLLSNHYRSQLNFSEEQLHNARKALSRLYQSLKNRKIKTIDISQDNIWVKKFTAAMNDDFNTPEALAVLFDLSRELNKTSQDELAAILLYLAGVFGLLSSKPEDFLQDLPAEQNVEAIEKLVAERFAARLAKNWQKSDEIRQQLLELGIELEDSINGTTWRNKI